MKAWPEILGPLGRALELLADPPNARDRPTAPDPDAPATFYFDGGFCLGITGGAREGGALGGLLIDASGVTAVYGSEVAGEGKVWPARETVDGPDPAFASVRARHPE